MKNKTIAFIGIASYILSVITSATDLQGNFVSPVAPIAISGIVTIFFVVIATIRLWKEARYISIMLVSSEIILAVLNFVQVTTLPKYGSPIIILLNITKVIHLVVFIWSIITLFSLKQKPTLAEKLKEPMDKILKIAKDTTIHPATREKAMKILKVLEGKKTNS